MLKIAFGWKSGRPRNHKTNSGLFQSRLPATAAAQAESCSGLALFAQCFRAPFNSADLLSFHFPQAWQKIFWAHTKMRRLEQLVPQFTATRQARDVSGSFAETGLKETTLESTCFQARKCTLMNMSLRSGRRVILPMPTASLNRANYWTGMGRTLVFLLASSSIACLLADFYGLCPMHVFTPFIFLPAQEWR